jgi:hypothetical protein
VVGCAGAQPATRGSGAPGAAARAVPAVGPVLPGIEVLLRDSLHLVRGRRVGLITNHTGRDRAGTSTIDLLARTPGVRLTALFAAEHGIRGAEQAGARIASAVDSATGVPIHSLYGERRAPTRAMFRDVDVLLYDMQDVGARVYTYVWTMALAAAAADSAGVPFVVSTVPTRCAPIASTAACSTRGTRRSSGSTRWRCATGSPRASCCAGCRAPGAPAARRASSRCTATDAACGGTRPASRG